MLTIADGERVAAFLRRQGIEAEAYSGATDHDDRVRLEQALLANELKVLVATSALGMGFDKPDLGLRHPLPVPRLADRLLPAGRAAPAARSTTRRRCCCAASRTARSRTTSSRPRSRRKQQAEQIVALLGSDAGGPMSLNELMAAVNVRRARLESMLKVLEVEGAVARERGGYVRTAERVDVPDRARRAHHRAPPARAGGDARVRRARPDA